jgi:hypothetical protein
MPQTAREDSVIVLASTPGAGGAELATALQAAGLRRLVADQWGVSPAHAASYTERILAAAQATWWAPPEGTTWLTEPEVVELSRQQRDAVVTAAGADRGTDQSRAVVWFDQRHPLLLKLWQRAIGADLGAVLLWSSPGQAVSALKEDGIRRQHALALWEDAVLRVLTSMVGQRVFVCNADQLYGGETESASAFLSFLDACGIEDSATPAALADALTSHPRPHPSAPDEDAAQADLVALLESRHGAHQEFASVGPRSLSSRSDELLAAHRAIYRLTAEARAAWLRTDEAERTAADAVAQLTQSMTGIDTLVNHLLRAM